METLLKDIKHTLRMFRESPGFAITAVAALTLAGGAAVFAQSASDPSGPAQGG